MEKPFLLACSGGIDSVVLTHLLAGMRLKFHLAHCNYQLRGEESDIDAEFVSNLAKYLNIKFHVKSFETEEYVLLNKVSIQEGARELRYRWFEELCEENGLHFIVTAHHADDGLETFLFHLSRGAGLSGLTGIPERNNNIVRPLLSYTKADIMKYALENNIEWRQDRSNEDVSYFRNKIRHELLPQFQELHPAFLENFRKSINLLKGTRQILNAHVEDVRKELFSIEGEETVVSIAELRRLQPLKAWCYELFHPFGFTDWKSVVKLIDAPSGKMVFSNSHQMLKDRENLIVRRLEDPDVNHYEIASGDQLISIPISLKISEVDSMEKASKNILFIDKETLNGRLHVRKWKKGDYFYPLGMRGRKLVSKFFKDLKFSQFQKQDQWLLCSGDDIIWIIGERADDRFKVSEATRNILKIEYLP